MKSKLKAVLNSAASLLHDCAIEEHAGWFREQVARLERNDSDSTVTEVATDVRSIIAGMGSFSDLSLQPGIDSGLSEQEVNDIKWNIVDKLNSITDEILRK
jgi:hypothetical protein